MAASSRTASFQCIDLLAIRGRGGFAERLRFGGESGDEAHGCVGGNELRRLRVKFNFEINRCVGKYAEEAAGYLRRGELNLGHLAIQNERADVAVGGDDAVEAGPAAR